MNEEIKKLVLEITEAAIVKKSDKDINVFVRLYPHVGELDVEVSGETFSTEYIPRWHDFNHIITELTKIKNKVLEL